MPSKPGNRLFGKRILVVDDEDLIRILFKKILEREGAIVVAVSSGKEALHHLGENEVDLLLTDIQMPDIDGFELSRRVRRAEKTKSLPIVWKLAHGIPGEIHAVAEELDVPHSNVLLLPVEPEELVEAAQKAMAA